ncbi:MAG: N-acetyltransferase family protein [Candidatus Dojkabacteria bacterium]
MQECGATQNFFIRELQYHDYEDLFAMWSDKRITDLTATDDGMTLEGAKHRVRNQVDNPFFKNYVACNDTRVVGFSYLMLYSAHKRRHIASFTVLVHADYQGKGIGKALTLHTIREAESDTSIEIIELDVFKDNQSAVNLYLSTGFEIEGILRNRTKRNGVAQDLYIMSRPCTTGS